MLLQGYSLSTGIVGALQECPQHAEQLGHHGQHAKRQGSNDSTEAKLLSCAWYSWFYAVLKQDRKAFLSRMSSLKADFNLYFGRDRSDTLADFSLHSFCDVPHLVFRVVLACLSEGSKSQGTRLTAKWKSTQQSSNQNFKLPFGFNSVTLLFLSLPVPSFILEYRGCFFALLQE